MINGYKIYWTEFAFNELNKMNENSIAKNTDCFNFFNDNNLNNE